MEELQTANVNRSIRTIKAELEYLCDVAVISPQDLSDLLSRIPPQTPIHAPISVGAIPSSLQQSQPTTNASEPPSFDSLNLNGTNNNNSNNRGSNNRNANGNSNANPTSFNEKVDTPYYGGPPNNTAPSPAPGVNSPYNAAPPQPVWNPTPPLANATALYAYTSADEGDLELQAGDSIAVTEYMNAEWWKGKSNRTGMEGIFPRSYVKVVEEKSMGYPGQPVSSVHVCSLA